ncbi:NAD-dependent epimerase/dehydratase family protein [Bradyrhizobium sp. HKCCYLS20291]|uniref:NAD-dependent epimerase/dehydratase family protein n=1 Tax=Bradyrhizobium sp. HKCCYLS20291 TaxID=3420766 RepID=UPI003EBBAA30
MRVCVTGGAGMIGRRLVARLARRGDVVTVVDDLSSGLPMPSEAAITERCDIRDAAGLHAVLRDVRPDAIVHLAALHHIPTCEADRSRCLDINVVGTETVLAAAAEAGVGRIVLASSGAVYQWIEGPLHEDTSPTQAMDNYALSKLCNESQLKLWCERGNGTGRTARIFNTLAHDDPNAHLLPDILAQLGQDSGVVRLGNVAPRRDYLHADDVAEGLAALLDDARPLPLDTFNICSGQEHAVDALVQCLAAVSGRSIRIEVDAQRRRRTDRPSQLGDPAKALALLGWRARLDLQEALQRLLIERGGV